jgi:hypothetical protein
VKRLRLLALQEIEALEALAASLRAPAVTEVVAEIETHGQKLPIRIVRFGVDSKVDPSAPVLILTGGVHGIEKIGSEVVLAHLRSFAEYAAWDKAMIGMLEKMRVIFVPIVNPGGVLLGMRSNPRGVDIMRNAPIESPELVSRAQFFRGHRMTPRLPWYRGEQGVPMEVETRALVDLVRKEAFASRLAICVDVHSGFGAIDRLWFPYGSRRALFPHVAEAMKLKKLLDRCLPNHVYAVEPQACQYTTHGDVWDYLYEEHRRSGHKGLFLPLTLEMGSWNWLKKNPFHATSLQALFHPIKAHRILRVLRRHSGLFEFLARAVSNGPSWSVASIEERDRLTSEARQLWKMEPVPEVFE